MRTAIGSVVALALALGLASSASAQNANLDEVAAALTLPVLTDYEYDIVTYNVVTNVSSQAKVLHINLIDGYDWKAANFSCYVTASETTLFKFIPQPDYKLEVKFECTNPLTGDEERFWDTIDMESGVMFVALEDPQTGQTINENAIFGDSVVINFDDGSAFSVGAVTHQGEDPGAIGVGDRDYRFDGVEYANFPGVLATNFLAPTTGDGANKAKRRSRIGVDAYLILFTLDGTVGDGAYGPQAKLSITFYNDDERPFSTSHVFDCFDIVALEYIDSRFYASDLGSKAGHMFMTPEIIQQANATHDFLFDGPATNGFDGMRRTPVHGWIFQTIYSNAKVVMEDRESSGNAAFARTLNQGTTALVPSVGDVPTLATN